MNEKLYDWLMAGKLIPTVFGILAAVLFAVVIVAGLFGVNLADAQFSLLKDVISFSLGGAVVGGASVFTAGKVASAHIQAQIKKAQAEFTATAPRSACVTLANGATVYVSCDPPK